MTTREYHLGELKVALDPSDPRHINPEIAEAEQVLDIGCGAGQTLIATCPGRITYGLDIDFDAMALGRSLTSDVAFVQGSAHDLPFASESFDVVVSRVALLYTDLQRSLAEIDRVLKPGGRVWMTLDTIHRPLKLARRAGTLKGWVYFSYVVSNSLLFHFFQKQIAFPRGRFESFQTNRSITRALAGRAFQDIRIQRARHFLVEARKPGHSERRGHAARDRELSPT